MAAAIPVAQNIKFIRRGVIHPARERLRRRRPRLRTPGWLRPSGLSGCFGKFVGAGFIPPAGVCTAAGPGGVRAPRPTVARVVATVRFGRSFRKVCRGGIYPAREPRAAIGTPSFAPRLKYTPNRPPCQRGLAAGKARRLGDCPAPKCRPREPAQSGIAPRQTTAPGAPP